MKTKLRIKIIWESKITRAIIAGIFAAAILLAIILPSILNSRPKGSILAFNRDATSGTREAFVNETLEWDDETNGEWTPGSNVREVRNNDSMITFVQKQENSVGYVSFGTVAEFLEDGTPVMRTDRNGMDHVSFATFNGVLPTYDNIKNNDSEGGYSSSRFFNAFFRVKQDSKEYSITNYDWATGSKEGVDLDYINTIDESNDFKAAYLFFNWFSKSEEALEIINENGEIPYSVIEENDQSRTSWFDGDLNEDGETTFDNSIADTYIDNMGINHDEQVLIEIVGSTSATALMTDLTKEFDKVISEAYGLEEKDLKFVIATNGSGDAVKETVPGTDHPFIGMQSKNQSADGFSEWGDYLVDGEYDKNVYDSFAIDAILIIYNNENVDLKEDQYLNVTSDSLRELYTDNHYMYADDVFTLNDMGGASYD